MRLSGSLHALRFASLGSGSRGNATLIEYRGTCVMLDCGFGVRELERRLARLDRGMDDLSAILVTHEHGDHVRGVAAVARRQQIPVWMTAGTARAIRQVERESIGDLRTFSAHQPFSIGELAVQPFPVPHDAEEPCQFVFSDGARRLGILTDVGSSTPHIERMLSSCDALMLECNHDRDMLWRGQYPDFLKARVGGPLGHLDNATAAALLAALDTSRLQYIVAAHLSEKNNTPSHARAALSAALGCGNDWIEIADQDEGLSWREIA